ncbi:probable metal-nicotianamine transporter YSL12 isoform X1 [Cryptomeria japonica]|uniref:probable metal-nicotianamine transporter YSL12 isoform X1 n=2 Tax=Cryptomeria japonica TaxID=3369 RepID=UPI0027DA70DC|nr:probable metal-nicotianamine transporter YSL12 isoform X1 [Cryptomeria japonica]
MIHFFTEALSIINTHYLVFWFFLFGCCNCSRILETVCIEPFVVVFGGGAEMDSYDHNPSELEMGGGPVKRTRNGDKESGGPDRDSAWVEKNEEDEKDLSVEKLFESKKVPPWWEQITFRGMFVSMLMGIMFSIIVMKLNLTTGIIPSLNVSAGLIGFFFMRTWTKMLDKVGLLKTPFTRQENTVIQTCVVACYGIAFSGGFGTYLLGMSRKMYVKAGGSATPGNSANDIKDPSLSWIIGFLFTVSFMGLLAVVPLRKIMVIDYKLTYPSGTATAILINGFHTPQGDKMAKKQVKSLGQYFAFSFLWGFFQWFFTAGDGCGFVNFPTLGLRALEQRFYFDFSMTYVGTGMICPHLVNVSLLLGAIMSWGLMWPLIKNNKGDWYTASDTSMQGLQGYKVFISIALILGDGLYSFIKILYITLSNMYGEWKKKKIGQTEIPVVSTNNDEQRTGEAVSYDEQRRNEMFMKDRIPLWVAGSAYIALAAIAMGIIPKIFPPVKWYYVLVAYTFAPVLGFCNAYGCGLTDWSLASTYGKLALFIFGAWAGKDDGGVIAGLAACGVMMSIVNTASDLMQDFKTGYLTLSSPRSMFVSQVIGTAMGCVIAPSTFWLFYKAFDVGGDGEYAAPYGLIYRNMAILGVEGFGALPKHCLTLCYCFFAFAIVVNLIRDRVPKKVSQYIPLPMAMAIPFYLGGYFAIDMCVGTTIVYIWQRINRKSADILVPAVASGLICGDGIWTLPSSILALAKVNPPICMKFLSRKQNVKVDVFLGS